MKGADAASSSRDYTLETVAVPMRDGVSLRTVVLRPKGVQDLLPVLLYRTPYKIDEALHGLGSGEFAADHIQVLQQVRGRCGSEGRLTLRQPLRGPFNSGLTDESTDCYDTIDWVVANVAHNNARVAMIGTSYSAWVALTATLNPHPALCAVVVTAPEVDCWRGDDDFRNGAFRLGNSFEYAYGMETDPTAVFTHFPYGKSDLYEWWLEQGNALDLAKHFGPESYFHRLIGHPTYDAYWQDQALDRRLAVNSARHVPTMIVQCLFDSYDPYGAPALFAATRARDLHRQDVFVAGPWDHGQNHRDAGERLGPLRWNESTAERWRREIARPFLAKYLRAPDHHAPLDGERRIHVFDTGLGRWAEDEVFAAADATPLYVAPERRLTWHAPVHLGQHEFISDAATPVPFRPRPIAPFYRSASGGFPAIDEVTRGFGQWLVDDQRFVNDRPDVLSLVSQPLEKPLTVRGWPTAVLRAITTGEDCDWIVKLIDVHPDDSRERELAGYQLMVSSEILRGRYRESLEHPTPIPCNVACTYRFQLSYTAHTFKPGHRVMVQIQSSWFPLHDRNPQRYVPIMSAGPDDRRRAIQAIVFGPQGSHLLLPLLDTDCFAED